MALACWQRTIVDEEGNVVPAASVRVESENTGLLPPLYSDRDGLTAIGNPFNADGEGFAQFFCVGGAYRVTASKPGFSRVWRYVGIGTNQEQDFGAQFLPRGLWNSGTTYAASDFVSFGGYNFVSNVAGNLNHQPVVSPSPVSSAYWTLVSGTSRYDFVLFDSGRPASGELMTNFIVPAGGMKMYAGLTDSRALVLTAPAADATFSLQKNSVQFGTLKFLASTTTAVFAAASDTTFVADDVFSIVAPSPRDNNLAGLTGTIVAYRAS